MKKHFCSKIHSKLVRNSVDICDLNGEKIAGSFFEKELQKRDQGKFRTENVLKQKGDKLYVKWKEFNN